MNLRRKLAQFTSAVSGQNFILQKADKAETITAERVRRVISGYGDGKSAVPGTGGGFDFYTLGDKLMENGLLNEEADTEAIREYVWFMETRSPLMMEHSLRA